MSTRDLITQGYASALPLYMAERDQLRSTPYIRKLLKLLRPQSTILDLGCGAGVPVDNLLLDAGHDVIGLDISPAMVEAALHACSGASYTVGDMQNLLRGQYAVDGVVSLYALFHVPRGEHGRILKTIRSFLPVGGPLLITMGDTDFEGTTNFYGQPMWWSQWGPEKNSSLIESAGFDIKVDEVAHSGAEHHQFVLARAC